MELTACLQNEKQGIDACWTEHRKDGKATGDRKYGKVISLAPNSNTQTVSVHYFLLSFLIRELSPQNSCISF